MNSLQWCHGPCRAPLPGGTCPALVGIRVGRRHGVVGLRRLLFHLRCAGLEAWSWVFLVAVVAGLGDSGLVAFLAVAGGL